MVGKGFLSTGQIDTSYTGDPSRFVAADAAIQVESPEDAGVVWIELLRNPERRNKMGENAKHLVDSSRGATDRVLAELSQRLGKSAQATG